MANHIEALFPSKHTPTYFNFTRTKGKSQGNMLKIIQFLAK